MRAPRPLARAAKRLSTGAASTWTRDTFSSSMSAPWLCSAFATAAASTLRTSSAPFFGMYCSVASALPAGLPRTTSATRRHFCGEMRAWRSLETTCMSGRRLDLAVAGVGLEGARRGELAQLVADHVLGDEHRDVLAAVVHGERQADHLRHHHGAARPGLDRLAVVARRGHLHLLGEVQIDERTLLE